MRGYFFLAVLADFLADDLTGLLAALATLLAATFLAVFFALFLAGLPAGPADSDLADFLAEPFPFEKMLSQFLVNVGLGPDRTIGPDIARALRGCFNSRRPCGAEAFILEAKAPVARTNRLRSPGRRSRIAVRDAGCRPPNEPHCRPTNVATCATSWEPNATSLRGRLLPAVKANDRADDDHLQC